MKKLDKRNVLIAVVALLLCAVSVWGYLALREQAQLDKVRAMSEAMRDDTTQAQQTPEQRREAWDELRAETDKLSPELRRQVFEEWNQRRMEEELDDLNEFFALSTDDQVDYIDQAIVRSEERRKEWEARQAEREREREQERQQQAANGAAAGAPQQAQPGNNTNRRSRTPQERDARRKERIDRSTPEYRAKRNEFRRRVQERRVQLGLPRSSRSRR